jgi:peptide/nickel transport system substrate-binding protein
MDKPFTVKDFFLFCLLLGLLVSVWLAMVQFDRQWNEIQTIRRSLDQQSTALARLEEKIDSGVMVSGRGGDGHANAAAGGWDPNGPFGRYLTVMDEPDFARGDWVIDAFPTTVDNITPMVSGTVYGSIVQGYVLESLARRDPQTLDFKPLLAESWDEQVNVDAYDRFVQKKIDQGLTRDEAIAHEDCPHAYTVTFTMRPSTRFSDGEPVTADDVVYSFDLARDPNLAPRSAAYYSRVDEVEKIDARTVVFRFKEPYYNSFSLAAGMDVLPQHFYEQYTTEQIKETPGLLMGSGPYQLENPASWKPGDPIRLVRNAFYWGVKPFPDRLLFLQVENDTALLTMFRNGEIDRLSATPEQYVELLNDPALVERTQHFEYFQITSGYCYIAWNQDREGKPWFADKRVRQALTMLIDRQLVAEEVLKGFGRVPTGPFNPLSKQNDPNVEPWPHDVRRARQLLKEAGLEDRDGDGVIEDAQGRPFVFDYTFPAGTPTWDDIARLVRDNLAEAGIAVQLDPLQFAVFVERLNNKNFDAISLCWGGTIESDPYQIFHSDMIEGEGDNFVSYANPQLDRVIDRARREVIEDQRMPLWRQVHRILHEDQPYTFLYSRKSLVFIDGRFQNVYRVKLGINDRTEWYVPKPLQER